MWRKAARPFWGRIKFSMGGGYLLSANQKIFPNPLSTNRIFGRPKETDFYSGNFNGKHKAMKFSAFWKMQDYKKEPFSHSKFSGWIKEKIISQNENLSDSNFCLSHMVYKNQPSKIKLFWCYGFFSEIFILKMDVKMNLMVITKNWRADPEIGFLTKSILQRFWLLRPFRQRGR